MTPARELWFLLYIGGLLLFFEGGITIILKRLNRNIPEGWLRVIEGILIIIVATIGWLNLPK